MDYNGFVILISSFLILIIYSLFAILQLDVPFSYLNSLAVPLFITSLIPLSIILLIGYNLSITVDCSDKNGINLLTDEWYSEDFKLGEIRY